MRTLQELMDALRERQVELGEGDILFARRLGINRETWRTLRLGRALPSRRVLSAIGVAFPDLRFELAASLFLPADVAIATEDGKKSTEEART